jgi:phage N-6-adenine-methyltransferase
VSLVGFKAQNHVQQVLVNGPGKTWTIAARRLRSSTRCTSGSASRVDVAAAAHNAKVGRFYSIEADGLAQSWDGERVWCNPPYSDIEPWVEKANGSDAELVVMLLPANRTEQGWWQRQVEPWRDKPGGIRCEFLPGRIRFVKPGQTTVGPNERPPFGCCLLIWGVS